MKMNPSLFLMIAAFMLMAGNRPVNARIEKCCGNKCLCVFNNGSVKANCSHISLDTVPGCPEVENDMDIFLLNKNRLERIENDSFISFPNLSTLDLSSNKLFFIHQYAFRNLRRLISLYLHGNKLMYKRDIYQPSMFEFQTSLTRLTMNDNENGDDSSLEYPDDALSTLAALQILFIDGLKNKSFGVGFSNLTNLTTIIISSNHTRCVMSTINKETFIFLPYLTEVHINCSLKFIEPGSFRHQRGLTMLDLSFNKHLRFGGVTNATSGISNTLECLYISRIVPWDAICVVIHQAFAKNLQNTSLSLLVADDNKIEAFESGAISLLPSTLSKVYMRGHNFQFQDYIFELSSLKGLTYVDLTGKDVRNFNYFQGPIHSLLRPEQLSSLQNDHFYEPSYDGPEIAIPPNLTNITVTYTQLYYNIGNFTVKANKLESLNVSTNLLTRWFGPVRGLEGLINIDLSYNFAHTVKADFFTYFPNVEYLDVSYNLLGHQIMDMEQANAFASLNKLRYFNLSENYIVHLPRHLFSRLLSLEILNLSRNRIHTLDIEISELKHLKVILCQRNNIQWLDEYARSQFDRISESGPLTLDLSGNPIACTCDNLHFLKWMLHTKANGKIKFGNLSNYYCYYTDGSNVTLEQLQNVYNNLALRCHNYVGFFIGMTCVFSGTLSLIIVGLIYRFRWKLRYFYYAARHRVNIKTSLDHTFTYDAFVSFAEEDRSFVVEELLNRLESESNMELNLHQRNFRPGRPIAENIIEAIQTSKRTLIILTENFLESYWCLYELQMANMESVTTGRDVLLIVMMEHIPTRKIPTQILYHIQTDSYLQYPSEGDTDMFWRNLTDALKR